MKKILVTLLILLFTTCALKNQDNREYKVELSDDSIDKYEFGYSGAFTGPARPNHPLNEVIKKYSYKYKHKYTYHICLQFGQFVYKKMCEDEKWRKRHFENSIDQTFKDWQVKYTMDSLNYIASVCMVEDSAGNEYMIYDKNNDEDFSNDPVVSFQTKNVPSEMKDTSYTVSYADSDVEFEYYNGEKITNGNYTIRLVKRNREKGTFIRISPNGKFGHVRLDGKKYMVGINNYPDAEFSKYDDIWIDLNHNKKYDTKEDYKGQMLLPFTVKGKSYKVSEIDRFGKSIKITLSNQDSIPPIAEGLLAPDFCEMTLDSSEFRLSDIKGKCVVLNFWSCDYNTGLTQINKVYNEFMENDKVEIVSFGPYDIKYLSPEMKKIKVDWPHVNGLFEVETRTFYQVGPENTTIIINPEGIITAKKEWATDEDIIKMVKEQIN